MDVTCARCGEPWDTYHLRHDEVHETQAAQEMREDQWALEDYEKDGGWNRRMGITPPKPAYRGEKWERRLTPFWRSQFADLGWKFGASVLAVLECPACKRSGEPLPDADERAATRQELAYLLGNDEDGLECILEDLALAEGRR